MIQTMKSRLVRVVTFGVVIAMVPAIAAGQGVPTCPGPGPGLGISVTSTRLGDATTLAIGGTPFVSGLLGYDLAGGPTVTPFGTFCLGLSPALQTSPFTLDALGSYTLASILPATPAWAGLTAFLQAAAADPSQPGGLAISNGVRATLRPPKMYFRSSFLTEPSGWCSYDAVTDTAGPFVPLPWLMTHMIRLPDLGWVAVLMYNQFQNVGTVLAFDDLTGAPVFTLALPNQEPFPCQLGVEGTTLFVHYLGNPGLPGALKSFALPSGSLLASISIPYGFDQLDVLHGTGTAYLRANYPQPTILPVDVVNGALFPPILLGVSNGHVLGGLLYNGIYYCTLGTNMGAPLPPPALARVNTATHTLVGPHLNLAPTLAGSMGLLLGPGTAGPAALYLVSSLTGNLQRYDLSTQALTAPVAVGVGTWDFDVSPGSSEILLLANTGPFVAAPILQRFDLATSAVLPVGPLPNTVHDLTVIPSTTLRKAYLVANGNQVIPLQTDPAVLGTTTVTLPMTNAWPVLVD
jgi:hypothetical protein